MNCSMDSVETKFANGERFHTEISISLCIFLNSYKGSINTERLKSVFLSSNSCLHGA